MEKYDIVKNLIDEIIPKCDSTKEIVYNIITSLLNCTSVTAIINEIIHNLPIQLSSVKQKSLVEEAAEKLFENQEPPPITADDLEKYSMEILENILDDVFDDAAAAEPHKMVLDIVKKLVDSLSTEFLEREESVQFISKKLMDKIVDDSFNRQEMVQLLRKEFAELQDVSSLMNLILQEVYGQGIDYLYIIND